MRKAAADLEFEEAARLRNGNKRLKLFLGHNFHCVGGLPARVGKRQIEGRRSGRGPRQGRRRRSGIGGAKAAKGGV